MDILRGLKPFDDIPEFAPDGNSPESKGFSEFMLNMKSFYEANADTIKEDLIGKYANEGVSLVFEEDVENAFAEQVADAFEDFFNGEFEDDWA